MALILGLTEWTHLTLCFASYKTFAVVRHVIDLDVDRAGHRTGDALVANSATGDVPRRQEVRTVSLILVPRPRPTRPVLLGYSPRGFSRIIQLTQSDNLAGRDGGQCCC